MSDEEIYERDDEEMAEDIEAEAEDFNVLAFIKAASKDEVAEARWEDVEAWKKEGALVEREKARILLEAAEGDCELALNAFLQGKDSAEVKAEVARRQKAKIAELEEENATLKERLADGSQTEAVRYQATDERKPTNLAELSDEDLDAVLKEEYAASADLQAEFGEVERYAAFKKAELRGRIHRPERNSRM